MKISKTKAISEFNCLLGDCPDTCCKGWSMQLNDTIFEKYKGTDLEDAVSYDGEDKEIRVMKRDKDTDFCVKFTDGICSIHAAQGDEMLGDACNFYPRVTRKLGDELIMTGTLSCPEVVRLMVFNDNNENFTEEDIARIPENVADYCPDELSGAGCLKTHQTFLEACEDESVAPEQIVARIFSAAASLNFIDKKEWPNAAGFMIKMADGKLPEPQSDPADQYKILQIFAGIIHATGKQRRERLTETIALMQKACGVEIEWSTLVLNPTDPAALKENLDGWKKNKSEYDQILRKFVQSQISFSTFPFAGLGADLPQKAKLIAYRFALTRLALMGYVAEGGKADNEESITTIIQSISRVMDHIADPTLTLSLMEQSGWVTDAKINGLVQG